jgi:hypothetical protein
VVVDHQRSGRTSFSEKLPNLQNAMCSLVDPNTCTHQTYQKTFRDTRMTAKAVIEALANDNKKNG